MFILEIWMNFKFWTILKYDFFKFRWILNFRRISSSDRIIQNLYNLQIIEKILNFKWFSNLNKFWILNDFQILKN
jgi:hypothetical protein